MGFESVVLPVTVDSGAVTGDFESEALPIAFGGSSISAERLGGAPFADFDLLLVRMREMVLREVSAGLRSLAGVRRFGR